MSVCAPESDLLKAVPHGRLTIRKADRVCLREPNGSANDWGTSNANIRE